MKKALLVSLALAFPLAAQAAVTAVCDGGTGGDKSVTKGSNFIINDFTMKCSANVYLKYDENATAVGVAAVSKKGKNIFAGGSAGGQVKPTGTTCTNCTDTSITDTIVAAALAGS
ncbi:MAG: hypothetical protein KDI53_12185 [Candidatus Accumulibacter sp.]|nr:hypothetical protein [Accumulibacter sp.]